MLNEGSSEATVQSDPFDLSRLRLSQDFAEMIGVKKAVIKPNVPLGLGVTSTVAYPYPAFPLEASPSGGDAVFYLSTRRGGEAPLT